jgi:ribonucleoside-diphosphate reductase alpha chain
MSAAGVDNALSQEVWASRYRYRLPDTSTTERSLADTWDRVAAALASVERTGAKQWQREFRSVLEGFRFLPAGRILAGAGTARDVTLFNCFVMDFIDDSMDAIFEQLRRSALTMQWGGGIGVDFSTLRPRGTAAVTRGAIASGPVSFMRIWDAMCATMLSTGARRGAMMGTLRCDHPDIEEFIEAKRQVRTLTNFNLSVQVTDELMRAVADDREFELCFPDDDDAIESERKTLRWPGQDGEIPCRIVRKLAARALWQHMMDAAFESAEPGVLFVDRINRSNNLYYCEHITSTNPCGEIPLPANGACNLGSVNLCAFVREPFSARASLDVGGIERVVRVAVRMLDNVITLSKFPLAEQAATVAESRRVGLGITGLGDTLIMLGLHYDSEQARQSAHDAVAAIRNAAYRASTELAVERGSFPAFDRDRFLAGTYVRALPDDLRDSIAASGIRNSHLLAIAPTGTISLLANNVSSGIEPVYAFEAERRVLNARGEAEMHRIADPAYAEWQRDHGGSLPAAFVTADELSPEAHLKMIAALQPLVDNSISKTINVAADISRSAFAGIYSDAYGLGLKGCTVFRPNPVTGAILSEAPDVQCCHLEREAD